MSINQNTTELQNLLEAVNSLPDALDTSDANVTSDKMLAGYSGYANGVKVNGNIPDNGEIELTIDGIDTTSISVPEGYVSGGTVSLDDTIPNKVAEQLDLISQIEAALVGKSGSGSGPFEFTAGELTHPAYVSEITVQHGLGKKPKLVVIFSKIDFGITTDIVLLSSIYNAQCYYEKGLSEFVVVTSVSNVSLTDTEFSCTLNKGVLADYQHGWIAIA